MKWREIQFLRHLLLTLRESCATGAPHHAQEMASHVPLMYHRINGQRNGPA
jgi:hypothetical protein